MQTLHGVTLLKNNNDNSDSSDSNSSQRQKKKIALLVGFLGTNYYAGMQINNDQKSLQAYLEWALYQAHYISPSNFGYPSKYSWSNSARTDKGDHASAQVCSTKVEIPMLSHPPFVAQPQQTQKLSKLQNHDYDWNKVRKTINQYLPPDIRILDVVRTTSKFCAQSQRNKVRYQYMIPSFILQSHT